MKAYRKKVKKMSKFKISYTLKPLSQTRYNNLSNNPIYTIQYTVCVYPFSPAECTTLPKGDKIFISHRGSTIKILPPTNPQHNNVTRIAIATTMYYWASLTSETTLGTY